MWQKFVAQFKAHPYLFGGIAVAIIVWIFWPRASSGGSGGDNTAATVANAAAANAQLQHEAAETQRVGLLANAQLALAAEETKQLGISTAAITAQKQAEIAGAASLAQIAANTKQYEADQAVKLADVAAAAQGKQFDAILASQNSAQAWAVDLEKNYGILPGNFKVIGFESTSSTIVKGQAPTMSSPLYGGAGGVAGNAAYNIFGDTMPNFFTYSPAFITPGVG